MPATLEIAAELDREDSRRRQLESDALAKLRLARPDLRVRLPPDERRTPSAIEASGGYGRLIVHLGERSVETTSTSRRELVTLIFELAGRPAARLDASPNIPATRWSSKATRRTVVLALQLRRRSACFLLIGVALTRPRRHPR